MPAAVTIDNYGPEVHERYAQDINALDTSVIDDANLIPPHLTIPSAQSTITTKWEELFETYIGIHPFALFSPPPLFFKQRNRFFHHAISENFDWEDDEEENEENKEEKHHLEMYRQKIKKQKGGSIPLVLLERDQKSLMNLFDSIETLNGFLRHIQARKLQYQKG